MNTKILNSSLRYETDGKYYKAENVDLGSIKHGIKLSFMNAVACSRLTITIDSLDGFCPAVVTCVSKFGYDGIDSTYCDIDGISGKHDIYFSVDGNMELYDVTFTDINPYQEIEYTVVPQEKLIDVESDTWEATDMLGRKVKSVEDVGKKRGKYVGIFYWSWRESHAHLQPISVTKTLEKFPGAEYNINHPAWGDKNIQCHWDEPLFGYYRNSDPYIIRHHAVLLANAGVDMIMFDCTNGSLLWKDAYEQILEGFHNARLDGIKTPQVAFMLNFGVSDTSELMLRGLYQDLYKPQLYSDLWFMVDGKPLIMAYPESLPKIGHGEHDTTLLNDIRNFFTFRPGQPLYAGGATRNDQWGWLEKYPQNKYVTRADGSCEMMTVGVGQNANDDLICTYFNNGDTYGRSYTSENQHTLITKDSYKYGYNVQEQWDRAIDCNPDFIFVTGWNEWMMGQFKEPWVKDADSPQIAFVDQFDREHSRDIEMDRDGYKDTYYLQLVSNIRRFKGAVQRQKTSPPQTILDMSQWNEVSPIYKNDKGTTIHRDYKGFGDTYYVNKTGRNDIVKAKVARDSENIYFYVETTDDITPQTNENWMSLFIDIDCNKSTGWEGYDFAINRLSSMIEKYVPTALPNSFTWTKIGNVDIEVDNNSNKLMIKIPRVILGLSKGDKLKFEFKWSDNMKNENIMDFYENGDTAPLGRFNYLFTE